jgi:hypothetical protein
MPHRCLTKWYDSLPSKNLWMQNLPGAKACCCPEDVAPGAFSPFHFSNSLTDRFHLPYDIKMDDSLCHWQQCLLAKCNAKFAFRIRIIRKTSSTYFSNLWGCWVRVPKSAPKLNDYKPFQNQKNNSNVEGSSIALQVHRIRSQMQKMKKKMPKKHIHALECNRRESNTNLHLAHRWVEGWNPNHWTTEALNWLVTFVLFWGIKVNVTEGRTKGRGGEPIEFISGYCNMPRTPRRRKNVRCWHFKHHNIIYLLNKSN